METRNQEVKAMFDEISGKISDFKASFNTRFATLEAGVRDVETVQARVANAGGELAPAVRGAGKKGRALQGISADAAKALDTWLRRGDESAFESPEIRAALQIGSDPDGGYLTVSKLSDTITDKLIALSPIRQLARNETLETGDAMEFIYGDRGASSGWVGEVSARAETNTPALKLVSVPLQEIYANPKTTQRLIDDSRFNIAEWLIGNVADEFSVQEGAAFVSGNGVSKPRGFTSYPIALTGDATRAFGTIQYVKTGVAGAFATATAAVSPADCLIDLIHSLKAGYRQGAAFVMNTTTLALARKWKDLDGRFVWQPALIEGQPSTIFGYPVYECPDMADVAANALPIAFANWERAYVVISRTVRILQDPYTSKPFVYFYSTKRVGGGVLDSAAIKLLKVEA